MSISLSVFLCLSLSPTVSFSKYRGPPEAMMHFSPVSDSPLFSKNFQTLWSIFSILPFPNKFLDFHPPKFLVTFLLVIDHKFQISPLFPLFQYVSPLFPENYYLSPYFANLPPCFIKIQQIFILFNLDGALYKSP